ncbi:conserved hypothetical protein [Coccidioides posadasii str. Silveira]|uniref:Uncharacterized protein n=1 Tax=Coccidioides posadasii (strain RMSCC 757 / Silveira) TaxID=443226 RepID=E9DJL9_COCPS|nr:conserved hypothetical protein [Coccidioides posadasii str. Silveira]
MLIRLRGLETGQSQPPFGFTSTLANPPSQSEAPKCHSERIAAMSAHQTLQGLDDEDESVFLLKTCTLNRKKLLNCLAYIHRNHHNIGSVKTDDSIYLWFCLANRPARAEDALDIYKFKHQPIVPLVTKMKTFDFNQYTQITEVNKFTTSNLQKEWETTGTLHTTYDAITTGRDVNMIQEFLTLTAEEPGDCTEILPEMYNHLENWWGLVKEQGLFTDGYIHCIKDTMYIKDNKRKFGIRWTNIICKSGNVQITSSLLPHGAHGPCKKVQHTMLPWYVAIQENHEHLEVNKAGAISDALVGQIRWDNPMVIEKLNILFGPDDKKAQDFINNWCLKTTRIALDAIVKTYQIEKKAFGNKSYWHCVHNNIDPASVWPSPPPKNLMEGEDHDDHY